MCRFPVDSSLLLTVEVFLLAVCLFHLGRALFKGRSLKGWYNITYPHRSRLGARMSA